MAEKTIQSFSIYFDTKENEDHSMDAKELGKALIAIDNTITEADKVLNGEESLIKVKARAIEEGSVGIPILVEFISSGKDVAEILGFGVGLFAAGVAARVAVEKVSAIDLISTIKNRKIVNVKRSDSGISTITLEESESEPSNVIHVDSDVEKLVTNQKVRNYLHEAILAPVRSKTDAKVVIKDIDGDVELKILDTETINSFKKLPAKTLLTQEEENKTVHVRFTTINFDTVNGWKVEYLNKQLSVKIEDKGFMTRNKQNKQTFKSGDLFEVKLKTIINYHPDRQDDIKYSITEVIRKVG
jgi:hypothetical protein